MAIKSGQADVVVAGGIEKMNDLTPERNATGSGFQATQNGNASQASPSLERMP